MYRVACVQYRWGSLFSELIAAVRDFFPGSDVSSSGSSADRSHQSPSVTDGCLDEQEAAAAAIAGSGAHIRSTASSGRGKRAKGAEGPFLYLDFAVAQLYTQRYPQQYDAFLDLNKMRQVGDARCTSFIIGKQQA